MFEPGIWRMDRLTDMFPEMMRFQRDMNRFFSGLSQNYEQRYPPVNVWVGDGAAIIMAEIPGMDPEKIEITTKGDILSLKGAREPEAPGEKFLTHRQEREYGRFSRALQLPFQVDQDRIEASYDRGILRIHLPQAEKDKPRKIAIKSE